MMWGYPWSGSMMAWMSIWGFVWLALAGLAIWALVQWVDRRITARGPSSDPSAMEVLRQRYARGEIDVTDFEQMRERLEARGSHTPVLHRYHVPPNDV